jgi:hypothetical protein
VSSRQQEKERRRQERLAAERAAASAASRRKRMTYALAGLLAILLIGVVALLATGAIGGDGGDGPAQADTVDAVPIPEQQIGDLQDAAKAAGCRLASPEIAGATHDPEKNFQAGDYTTNPPTSGDHNPVWYEDGIYEPGTTPRLGELVHTLEHGRINVQYKPGTPERTVGQLESVLAEFDGYHMLLYENTTGMDAAVAATTWGQSLTCPRMNDKVFDALRTFTREYVDTGPEQVP